MADAVTAEFNQQLSPSINSPVSTGARMNKTNVTDGLAEGNGEQETLVEIGRVSARLIHDFKNQLGGLKLYTAYLKKRVAANSDLPETLEIVEKIAQSINEMAENANLIGKLSRPVDLKLAEAELASLIEQALKQLQSQIEERRLQVVTDLDKTLLLKMDSQQVLAAIAALLNRAIEVSPENGCLNIKLQNYAGELRFSIFDEGQTLNEKQCQSVFDFVTNERLNRTSLNLALAKRIVETHGWQIAAYVAEPSGTEIRLTANI